MTARALSYAAMLAVSVIAMPAMAETVLTRTQPARADSAPVVASRSWSGCYLAGQGGVAVMDTKASLADTAPGTTTYVTLDGLGATGAMFGASGGCDVQVNHSWLVLGAFGSFDKFNQTAWNLDVMPPGGINFRTALDSQWSGGVRVGAVLTPATMVYAKLGLAQLKMDAFSGTSGGSAIGSLSMPTFNGYLVGGGIETALPATGWFMGVDYAAGIYQNAAVPIASSGYSLNVEPLVHTATAKVIYKFNFAGN